MKLIDLTHTFTEHMPVYPGDPVPEIVQVASLGQDGYTDFKVTTGMHIGTHMDGPLHFVDGGKKLSDMPVEQFIGPGVLIDARGKETIGLELLSDSVKQGSIVLVLTSWSAKFRQPDYYEKYPVLSEDFAQGLIERGAKAVGLDTPSPDTEPFSVHKILLGKDVLIIENLANLEQLVGAERFEVLALPAKFDTEAAPVRVVARA